MKKVGNHTSFSRILFLCLAFMLTFSSASFAQDAAKGRELFNSQCAACHKMDTNSTSPSLRGMADRHPADWLHKWIKDSPGLIKSGDAAAVKLFNDWNKVPMNAFPILSDEDIDNIIAYTSEPKPEPTVAATGAAQTGGSTSGAVPEMVILGGLVIVLGMLVIMLVLVRRVLNKIAEKNDLNVREQKTIPIWKAFVKNQFMVITSVIFLMLADRKSVV